MKTFTFLFFLMLMMTETFFAQALPPVEPGVSLGLAKWRAANYSDVRYKLNITLEKGAPLMHGTIEIRVNLTEEGAKNHLLLDWRTTQFENDKDKPYANVTGVNDVIDFLSQVGTEHILIPSGYLKKGENVITLEFASPIKTSGAAITRYVDKEDSAEYIYSLFVPSDASTAFPVFDQPDLKARFSLNVKAPYGWAIVSNTDLLKNSSLNDGSTDSSNDFIKSVEKERNGNSIYEFKETQPISTYVFAFAAGDFAVFNESNASKNLTQFKEPRILLRSRFLRDVDPKASQNVIQLYEEKEGSQIYVRKSQAEKFKVHADEVFRLNREGVKYLESYFDYKFPFPKYDLVLIPEFPFGGMEHAGATFLRESSIIFPTEPTKNDYVSRANVIFHEAAHQWFGDCVTMKWFDDLWLKEGFAEFMAYKTLEKVMPEYNAWKIFYERNKQAAYLTDSTRGTTPIYQEIANLSAAKSAYGNIVYRKAPSFLRQAEFFLGEDKFQTAVRAFLKNHEFANAEWTDLASEFVTATRTKISSGFTPNPNLPYDTPKWANTWIRKAGLPITRIYPFSNDGDYKMLVFKDNSESAFHLNYSQISSLGNDVEWGQKVLFLQISENGQKQVFRAILDNSRAEKINESEKVDSKDIPPLKRRDEKAEKPKIVCVFPNYQDYGYGIFLLDAKSRDYVLQNIQSEKDDFLRTMMWGSLWDSVRETELAPQTFVELVIKNLAVESDESTIQTLLGRVSLAMNYYLSDAQAAAFAPRLEALLADRIANAATLGQRITFYRAFLNLASSAKSAQILKDILAGKSKVAVFGLKTKDKFDIVTRLLILGDKDAPQLLANLEKTETSDEAKRYAYAARAGVGTAETKAKYFRDFLKNKDISESWIEAAFNPFNSPKHSDLTLQYLETALAELSNLKKNRKIFFINGWLSAFIGGQRSEAALAVVNKFLADNPNLDKDLRLKILENVDALERAVKIRAKYGK